MKAIAGNRISRCRLAPVLQIMLQQTRTIRLLIWFSDAPLPPGTHSDHWVSPAELAHPKRLLALYSDKIFRNSRSIWCLPLSITFVHDVMDLLHALSLYTGVPGYPNFYVALFLSSKYSGNQEGSHHLPTRTHHQASSPPINSIPLS